QETARSLYYEVNKVFCYLSVAAIIGNKYFCAHGGISPWLFTRRQLRGLHKPCVHSSDDVFVNDMVWSDPAIGLRGTAFNFKRGTSIYFGLDALVHALKSMGCVAILRGHTMVKGGYEITWGVCFTIFSAS
ncbi:hypothetical protein PMAYCL1PPCAC_27656, partial [Pristionchus mayeri]